MSTISDLLLSIEQRAERAIVQELRQMIHEILAVRTALVLTERARADALLLKLDRLVDDRLDLSVTQEATPACAPPSAVTMTRDCADNQVLSFQSPSSYEVRFFSRDHGELLDVIATESFRLAVQLAKDRFVTGAADHVEATWGADKGVLSIRAPKGHELVRIRPTIRLIPVLQPQVDRACQALECGDPALTQQLFKPLRRVA